MGESTLIRIGGRKKRLLELEKTFTPNCRSIDEVLGLHIDFDSIERRFKRLLSV